MERGKRAEAAGPSGENKADKLREMKTEKPLGEFVLNDGGEDDDNDDDEGDCKESVGVVGGFSPGPLVSLKEQIEKDKDDDSLRRWKEKLLGCLEEDLNDQMEPEVKFHSFGIISDDIGEITIPLPVDENQKVRVLFTLKEGARYQYKITFSVLHNIVSGLAYSNTVWKAGLQVDESKGMLGTFAPQREPYVHTLDEEITPCGVLARGIYSAKLKFEDDDRRCYMELKYSFEIKKSN